MKCYCTPANSLFLLNHFGYVAASPFIVVLVCHPLRPPLPSRTFACFNRRSKSASIDSACASLRVQCMHRTSTLLTRLILCSESLKKSQCFGPTISCGLLLTFDISDVNLLRWAKVIKWRCTSKPPNESDPFPNNPHRRIIHENEMMEGFHSPFHLQKRDPVPVPLLLFTKKSETKPYQLY